MSDASHTHGILNWNEDDVAAWLRSIGFAQYEQPMIENNITGDVLCRLELEFLKGDRHHFHRPTRRYPQSSIPT